MPRRRKRHLGPKRVYVVYGWKYPTNKRRVCVFKTKGAASKWAAWLVFVAGCPGASTFIEYR